MITAKALMKDFHKHKVPFVRPESSSARETVFDVEGVAAKLTLKHNLFEHGIERMYDDDPSLYDEFGPLRIKNHGRNWRGEAFVTLAHEGKHLLQETFFYANKDESFYICNPDGSQYYLKWDGTEWYVPPPKSEPPVVEAVKEEEENCDSLVKMEVKKEAN
ncbi:hypothetical protein SCHPADRAFT_1002747 [Schizopora paradoxa]|uniref:Uncharacterized protein n=1 Tax=Schizopora paradoxa TaxID=27342 RepID=A0A0H2RLK6_9AGAM|nr:hypothetical protein SCHPADRAFT_1002747 [Schizopora paradoxa]